MKEFNKIYSLLLSIMVCFIVVSCGGGGGGDGEDSAKNEGSNNVVTITQNNLHQYSTGEFIIYEFSLSRESNSGKTSLVGDLKQTFFITSDNSDSKNISASLELTPEGETPAVERQNLIQHKNGSIISVIDNIVQGDYPTIIHSPLGVGVSWSGQYTVGGIGLYLNSTRTISRQYAVTGVEVVQTPYGKFEAYKIQYIITGNPEFDDYQESGTDWVHPKIGVIKSESNVTYRINVVGGGLVRNTFIVELSGTNISF